MTRFVMTWDEHIAPALTLAQAYARDRSRVLRALTDMGDELARIEVTLVTDEQIAKTLIEALAAAHEELPTVKPDKTNPAFKSAYASLGAIIEAVTPVLNRHGLVWYTLPTTHPDSGAPMLAYRLAHVSGEEIAGMMPLMVNGGSAQQYGSALTYARRYALTAVLNLATDDDDDGNQASGGTRGASSSSADGPSVKQLEYLQGLVRTRVRNEAELSRALSAAGVDVQVAQGWTGRLSKGQASAVIEALKERPVLSAGPPPAADVPAGAGLFDPPAVEADPTAIDPSELTAEEQEEIDAMQERFETSVEGDDR